MTRSAQWAGRLSTRAYGDLVLSASTLAFDGTSGFSFAVDKSGDNGLLIATFTAVPEPASFALLAAGGLLALDPEPVNIFETLLEKSSDFQAASAADSSDFGGVI